MSIALGDNQYGKAETRVVRIYRDKRHEIRDLNVSTALRGDFSAAHLAGDQAKVLPTDTQKNTAFAYAKEHGAGAIEDYALALARHFTTDIASVTRARVDVDEYRWERISVDGTDHPHAFVRSGQEIRSAAAVIDTEGPVKSQWVVSGVRDLVLLKSTGSQFMGFLRDRYTTLAETSDRILATSLTARWRYAAAEVGGTRRSRRSGRSCWSGSRCRIAARCSRRCGRWARPCSRPGTTSLRSGCRRRTSITFSLTCRRTGWTIPARCSTPTTGLTG